MAVAPINPTALTPPRVAFIDERTGAISREWYRFFLSLLTATQDNQTAATIAPDATSLTASLENRLDILAQTFAVEPRNELGTISYLQQDNVPWITFSSVPSNVPPTVGTTFWDGGTTLNIQMTANVIGRINETEFVYVKASAAITKGQLCYHTGSVGSSGVITAAPTPLNLADPNQIIGVAAETIALNGFGLIQISGDLRGFNTTGSSVGETWADGDPLYYNPAYVGSLTKTKPLAPNQKSYIGEVINAGSGSSGSIHIRITPGSVLGGTDSNVQFSGVANNDLIQYDSALQYWKNVAPSTVSVGTATNLAGGAANQIAYQTAPGTTSFSANLNYDSTNSAMGLGRASQSNVRLYVKGSTTGNGAFQYYSENSAGTACFGIRDDGGFYTGDAALSPYNLTTAAAANVVVAADQYLYRSTSSARYKKNIVDYDRGLDAVMSLRPVYYEGKNEIDSGKRFAGFIAEEVYAAGLDEFVVLDEDKKPDALHYGNMTALLVRALQDAAQQIDSLSTRVAALERH